MINLSLFHTTALSAATDSDFSSSITYEPIPLWVFIVVGVLLIGASLVGVIIFEDIAVILPILIIGSITALVIFAIFSFATITTPATSEFSDNKKLQSWVQDKYLIDITEEQAQYLLESQVDLGDSPYSNQSAKPVFVENAYGNIVSLTLVKKDNEWTLVQQADTSAPITIEDK